MQLRMTIDDALAATREWTRGTTLHEDSDSPRVWCILQTISLSVVGRKRQFSTISTIFNEIICRIWVQGAKKIVNSLNQTFALCVPVNVGVY